MIEEVGDTVLHLLLLNSDDTDFLMQKPDGTQYLIQVRKNIKSIHPLYEHS